MITVEVYRRGENASPIATLSYSGKGKKCTISTLDMVVEEDLKDLVNTVLYLPKRSRAYPEARQAWMEALPESLTTFPYWYKIADATDKITEEDEHGNEDDEEDNREEDDDSEDSREEDDDGGDAADDGESDDNGGNEDGLADPSNSRTEDGGSTDGGSTDGKFLNSNG